MTLNFISNYAAQQAARFVGINSDAAADSVAKLASGSRVVRASDDVAALAIGSRLATEVASLETAQVNAGQAASLLQIADGALSSIQDILTRAKTLAVQAGSQSLGDSERALIDTEFQDLLVEIDRIAADTEFAGKQLINRENGPVAAGPDRTNLGQEGTSGVVNLAVRQFDNRDIAKGGDGSFTVSFTAAPDAGSNIVFTGAAVGKTGSLAYAATITTDLIENAGNTSTAVLSTGTTLLFVQDADKSDTATYLSDFTQNNAEFVLSLDSDFNVAALYAGTNEAGCQGTLALAVSTTGPFQAFNFKIGSGIIPSQDTVSIDLGGATTENLGLGDLDMTTFSRADATSQAVSHALDFLVTLRSEVGAATNQVDSASENLAIAIENTEAARSTLLDLNVASEVTNFTSQQILVQAGISVLAQANQLPQNLLRLFL